FFVLFVLLCGIIMASPSMSPNIRGEAMIVLKRAAFFFVLIGATLLFTACPSQTNIRKINANPDRYRNKEVGIAGRVTDSYGALGVGGYEIDDGTGRMCVASEIGLPAW